MARTKKETVSMIPGTVKLCYFAAAVSLLLLLTAPLCSPLLSCTAIASSDSFEACQICHRVILIQQDCRTSQNAFVWLVLVTLACWNRSQSSER